MSEGWHIAHPPQNNLDERVAICGSSGPAFGMWEKFKELEGVCPTCLSVHKLRLRDLGRRLSRDKLEGDQ